MNDVDEKTHRAAVGLLKWWLGVAGMLVVAIAGGTWAVAAYTSGLARAESVQKVETRTTVLETQARESETWRSEVMAELRALRRQLGAVAWKVQAPDEPPSKQKRKE